MSEADNVIPIEKADSKVPGTQTGVTGLIQYGGRIGEEFLQQLQGEKALKVWREMRDNDPVVGAVLFAVDMLMRQVDWRVDAVDDESKDAKDAAQFVEECIEDLDTSWSESLSAILSMLPFGWSYHETLYKRRSGHHPEDPTINSIYSDGKVGWRKFEIRAQETLFKWEFDDNGQILGMWQSAPPHWDPVLIPIEKSLLFRTTAPKNNPEGRALDPATPIFTPDGWSTMGDLQEGDKVFDEAGRMRYVVGVADWEARPRYRMLFSDGSVIIADAEHQWETTTVSERARRTAGRVRTTEEIGRRVQNTNGVTEHAVAWAFPLDLPAQELLVDPYVLGLWLGDGTTLAASIACHVQDAQETAALIEQAGYPVKELVNGTSVNGRSLRVYGDLQRSLRVEGLLGDKHVPEHYLRGSAGQRLSLLQGLMDSDGTVDKDGRCEFANTNQGLVDAVGSLVRSLGVGCRVSLRRRATEGIQEVWCAKFTPTFMPFRLERKRGRCKEVRARKFHYIVECEPIEDGPTRCIETDGPSHLFLAGEGLVASHNSILRNAYRPWFYKKRIEEIEAIGIERDLAGLPIAYIPAQMLSAGATTDETAAVNAIKKIVAGIKRDEQEGVVFPQSFDEKGNKRFELALLSTGGRRQFDTSAVIGRYESSIAQSVMADFIMLGHSAHGTYALGTAKMDMFSMALGAWLDMVAEVFNNYAIPRLFELNNMDVKLCPSLTHADVKRVDLAEIGAYVTAMSQAGAPMFPDEELENYMREVANLPEKSASAAIGAADAAQNQPVATPVPAPGQPGQPGQQFTQPGQPKPGQAQPKPAAPKVATQPVAPNPAATQPGK